MENNNIYMWYIVAIINSALAGLLTKYYVQKNNMLYLYAAIFCNVFLIFAYTHIFNDTSISTSYVFIKIMAIMLVSFVGFTFFREECNSYKILGIIFGIIAIYLLSIKNE